MAQNAYANTAAPRPASYFSPRRGTGGANYDALPANTAAPLPASYFSPRRGTGGANYDAGPANTATPEPVLYPKHDFSRRGDAGPANPTSSQHGQARAKALGINTLDRDGFTRINTWNWTVGDEADQITKLKLARNGEAVASGGMSTIHIVEMPNGKTFAAKEMKTRDEHGKAIPSRLGKRMAANLRTVKAAGYTHKIMCEIYGQTEIFFPGGKLHTLMIMEEVNGLDGRDLKEKLDLQDDQQKFAVAKCVGFNLLEMVNSLSKVGDLGYVHGDLKPDNLLFRGRTGALKVGDWDGFCEQGSKPPAMTTGYAAPEVIKGRKINERRDTVVLEEREKDVVEQFLDPRTQRIYHSWVRRSYVVPVVESTVHQRVLPPSADMKSEMYSIGKILQDFLEQVNPNSRDPDQENSRHLMKWLTHRDRDRRPTPEEAMGHVFFSDRNQEWADNIVKDVIALPAAGRNTPNSAHTTPPESTQYMAEPQFKAETKTSDPYRRYAEGARRAAPNYDQGGTRNQYPRATPEYRARPQSTAARRSTADDDFVPGAVPRTNTYPPFGRAHATPQGTQGSGARRQRPQSTAMPGTQQNGGTSNGGEGSRKTVPENTGPETVYTILGVAPTAQETEIKSAYRKLVLKVHPDKFPDELKTEKQLEFNKLQAAYDILTDAAKRRRFDAGEIDNEGKDVPWEQVRRTREEQRKKTAAEQQQRRQDRMYERQKAQWKQYGY